MRKLQQQLLEKMEQQQYQNEEEKKQVDEEAWGTWEELLLACAVKRHGVEDWDSVAMEVQGKTSLSQLHTTAFNCKQKYHDLQRRFHQDDEEEEDSDPIPWLHHLKSLRLAQLRHDLHRFDVSITSLETKVKRLGEERKHDDEEDQTKPDLEEHNSKRNSRSEDTQNDKKQTNEQDRFVKQENQSANGSNSTCSKTQEDHNNNSKKLFLGEPDESVRLGGSARAGQSESDDGSCETVRRRERESGSSEAQSSASLTRQRRRMLELKDQQVEEKSQPLAAVLEKIRAHQHGYLFERRLTSQESDEYKSMVHQHVDLATIEAKLQNRTDSSSCDPTYSALPFYRDLLLLFTNAIVFFPKSSTESMAANQLRRLVLNEINKCNLITTRPVHPSNSVPSQAQLPKLELDRSDSLLAKHKSTTPIFVCRKRSLIASKPSSIAPTASTTADHRAAEALGNADVKPLNNSKAKITEDDNVSASAVAAKKDEKPVKDSSTKKNTACPAETPKAGKKRKATEDPATPSNKKRSGAAAAADFLKRLKRNSPAQQKGKAIGASSRGAEQKKRGGNSKKADNKVKERVSKQSGRGENKKQVKEESSPSKRSVGRPSKKAADTSATTANVVSAKRSRENVAKQQRPPRKRSRW